MQSSAAMAASGRVGGRDCRFRPVADRVAHNGDAHEAAARLSDAVARRCLAEVSRVTWRRIRVDDPAARPSVNGCIGQVAR